MVSIVHENEHVRVSVANPGERIKPSVLEHLFDRFYRAEASRTNSRENHGLGLAIVKAVAEMHEGAVFVYSEMGVNTFGFTVPALRPVPQVNDETIQDVAPLEAQASAASAGSLDSLAQSGKASRVEAEMSHRSVSVTKA
jgi:two-component system heavy metal sensor histidine kinase CusS